MIISDVWAPVVAALGASFLTGAIAFGLDWRQARRASDGAREDRRNRAYSQLLAVAGIIAHTAGGLRLVMQMRSGLGEGLDVALRVRKPLDTFDLLDRLRRDEVPLYQAWSEVWAIGSQEAITAANELVDRCGEVIGTAVRSGEGRGWLAGVLAGQKWSKEEVHDYQKRLNALAVARRGLALVARREAGVGLAELFTDSIGPRSDDE